ncbi:MAG TPA: glycosyltransferase [Candidatus Angelobacter sp.]|nr:glycosyltransferase [Candidatus Angelobacter sp.]
MRIVLSTLGSLGDVQPLLALGQELQKSGHEAVMALSPNFELKTRGLNLEFFPIGPAISFEQARLAMAAQMRNPLPAEQVRQYLEVVLPALPQIYSDLRKVCTNADALIGAPFHVACRMVEESLSIPYISLHLSQFGDLGGKEIAKVSAALINPCRMEQGLRPVVDPLGAGGTSDHLAIYAVSRHLLRAPSRWPSHYKVVGFFFLDEELWEPPPDLNEFCKEGEPPIAVTFGSIVHDDPASVTDMVVEAVQQAGCRAILQHGWSGLGRETLPQGIHAVGYVPHSWLFSKVSLVIHHGSAGTTSSAFQSGVPAIVVPHTLDQPIWAQFTKSMGCAKEIIPFSEMTSSRLAEAIKRTLGSAKTRVAAKMFAEKIRQENGPVTARKHIEEVLLHLQKEKMAIAQ